MIKVDRQLKELDCSELVGLLRDQVLATRLNYKDNYSDMMTALRVLFPLRVGDRVIEYTIQPNYAHAMGCLQNQKVGKNYPAGFSMSSAYI